MLVEWANQLLCHSQLELRFSWAVTISMHVGMCTPIHLVLFVVFVILLPCYWENTISCLNMTYPVPVFHQLCLWQQTRNQSWHASLTLLNICVSYRVILMVKYISIHILDTIPIYYIYIGLIKIYFSLPELYFYNNFLFFKLFQLWLQIMTLNLQRKLISLKFMDIWPTFRLHCTA